MKYFNFVKSFANIFTLSTLTLCAAGKLFYIVYENGKLIKERESLEKLFKTTGKMTIQGSKGATGPGWHMD